MEPRRVVTGTSAEGKSVVASDTLVEPMTLGADAGGGIPRFLGRRQATRLSRRRHGAALPRAGFRPPMASVSSRSPSRPIAHRSPPTSTPPPALAEVKGEIAGPDRCDGAGPSGHAPDRLDRFRLCPRPAGACMVLDDDTRLDLDTGDTVIQNGTRHGWRVPYDEPCRSVRSVSGDTTGVTTLSSALGAE